MTHHDKRDAPIGVSHIVADNVRNIVSRQRWEISLPLRQIAVLENRKAREQRAFFTIKTYTERNRIMKLTKRNLPFPTINELCQKSDPAFTSTVEKRMKSAQSAPDKIVVAYTEGE